MIHWSKIPEIVSVLIVIVTFATIERRRPSVRTKYWIAGWVCILLHFIAQAFAWLSPELACLLTCSTLIAGGGLFFVSNSQLGDEPARAQRLTVLIIAPFLSYLLLAVLYPSRPLLAAVTLIGWGSLTAHWFFFYRRRNLYSLLLLSALSCACASNLVALAFGNPDWGIIAGLAGLYANCANGYWARYRRASAGVLISVAGFLAWGAVFPAAAVLSSLYPGHFSPELALWNVPKYFVAGAMILTLLEDESLFAEHIAHRYRLLFDRSLCGVFRCTLEGRLLEYNDAFSRIFQDADKQVLHMDLGELLKRPRGGNLLHQVREQGQMRALECTFPTADGAIRTVIASVMLVPGNMQESTEIEGVLLDISDFRSMENQIREAQKLDALGQLAGGVAHDFNNLLMIITAHLELLEPAMLKAGASPAQLEAVKSASARGASITRELLTFSRRKPTEPRALDLNKLVQEAHGLILPVLGERIQLEIKTTPQVLETVADENQITLVLLNLVLNARDAMPEGGLLVIETSAVELDSGFAEAHQLSAPGEYLCIAVSDTGSGIAPEIQSRVFEPFFTTKPKGKGTGLGLPSCYGIVQQHGGNIALASAPGIGTTVRIYLPRSARKTAESLPSVESRPVGRVRLLMVDDEETLRGPATLYLRGRGYSVVEAASGPEALQAFESEPFDVVVTDMVMPGMSGRQLGNELKRRAPSLPVIYISGYAQEVLETQGHLSPDEILLEKPYSLKRLAQIIDSELARCRQTMRQQNPAV